MNWTDEMIRVLSEQGSADPEELSMTRELLDAGVIPESQAKRYVIRAKFWAIYKGNPDRTARDVELELCAVYDLPLRTVQRYRSSR